MTDTNMRRGDESVVGVCDFFLAFTDNNDTHPPMTEPGFFK
jgi:hypothetical protein